MKKEKKTAQLIMRITEAEKEFLIRKSEEENRTISAIVTIALREKYEEYQKIRERNLGVTENHD
jgi:hypothetical protein